jgi:hypothetical protein
METITVERALPGAMHLPNADIQQASPNTELIAAGSQSESGQRKTLPCVLRAMVNLPFDERCAAAGDRRCNTNGGSRFRLRSRLAAAADSDARGHLWRAIRNRLRFGPGVGIRYSVWQAAWRTALPWPGSIHAPPGPVPKPGFWLDTAARYPKSHAPEGVRFE